MTPRVSSAPGQMRSPQGVKTLYQPRARALVVEPAAPDLAGPVHMATVETESSAFNQVRDYIDHPFVQGPRKCPIEVDQLVFRAQLERPPLCPPLDRSWYVYPEDVASASSQKYWGLPLIEKYTEEERQKMEQLIELTVGKEQTLTLMLFNAHSDWMKCLEDGSRQWICKFPGRVFRGGEEREMRLTFRYSSTVGTMSNSLNNKVPIPVPHLSSSLRAFLGPDVSRIVPVQMWVSGETAVNLPMDVDVQLYSKRRGADGAIQLKPWFFNGGPNPSPSPNPDALVLSRWVDRGTHSSSRDSPAFWCAKSAMSADFARWASTDYDALEAALDSPECKHDGVHGMRFIKDVPKKGIKPLNELQFLCLTEWQRIKAQTELRLNNGMGQCYFEETEGSTSTGRFEVGEPLMRELIQEKKNEVDAANNIMDLYVDASDPLSALVLQIRKVHAEVAPIGDGAAPASYSCTVHLRFCVLD